MHHLHQLFPLILGALASLSGAACAAPEAESEAAPDGDTASAGEALSPVPVSKAFGKKVHVHVMPWFETNASSGNGAWGIHWTMANRNPDVADGTGKRQIASYYYPLIGPYASGDRDVIEYQLLLMKYAGADGILLDWPGTVNAWDYAKNRQNAEAMIAMTAAVGLDFAVVYEDHNVGMAKDAGLVGDAIAAAKADVAYLRDNYWTKSNYIQVKGAPLLLDFGPQTFVTPSDWAAIFAVLPSKPTFLTLWYQQGQAGASASGEFPWIYSDGAAGLANFYSNHPLDVKFGVAYPGFDTFYGAGGWGGPGWTLPYDGTGTFAKTLDMAKASSADAIQIATWNDYGEGTMIEPTREFGYGFLTTMQTMLGVPYSRAELELIDTLYRLRKQYAGDAVRQAILDKAFDYLVTLQVPKAAHILLATSPRHFHHGAAVPGLGPK